MCKSSHIPRLEERYFFLKTTAPKAVLSSTPLARVCSLKTPETPQSTCADPPPKNQECNGTCKPAWNVNGDNFCILHTYMQFVQIKVAGWAHLYLWSLFLRLGLSCPAARMECWVNVSCAERTTSQSGVRQYLPRVLHVVFTGHNAIAWFLKNPCGLYVGLCDISKVCENTGCFSA